MYKSFALKDMIMCKSTASGRAITDEERFQEKNADTSYEIGTILSLGEDQGILFKQYAYVKIVFYIVF